MLLLLLMLVHLRRMEHREGVMIDDNDNDNE